jgi:hypothetical protein
MRDGLSFGCYRTKAFQICLEKTIILRYAFLILLLSITISFTEAKPNSFQLNLQRRLLEIEEPDHDRFTMLFRSQETDMSYYETYMEYARDYPFLYHSELVNRIVYNIPFELYEKYYQNEIPLFQAFNILKISVHLRKEHYLRFKIPFYK